MYKFGYICGLIVTILIVVISIRLLITKTNTDKQYSKYDERQELVRGRGYKMGFFSMLIMSFIFSMCLSLEEKFMNSLIVPPYIILVAIIFISVIIFAGYCIFNDGYFGINNNRKFYYILFLLIGVFNLTLGTISVAKGTIYENGKLGTETINLMSGIVFLLLGIMVLIKSAIDKKSEDIDNDLDDEE